MNRGYRAITSKRHLHELTELRIEEHPPSKRLLYITGERHLDSILFTRLKDHRLVIHGSYSSDNRPCCSR